ncbi:MAG: phosphatidylserine/phosphatidylglycerophosphate/cardiolipin synthase family protein [Candidatus Krumholzibacteriia bacterium]
MHIQIQVDAEEFWPSLQSDIRAARDYVYIQTLSLEGDAVGKAVSRCLAECAAPDRRIIADEFYTKHRINDKYLHSPRNWFDKEIRAERDETLRMMARLAARGVAIKLANPSGPLTLLAFARAHKKIIAVDDRVAYIGGINFTEHNFAWHDMMLRVEDTEMTTFLKEDFLGTWQGIHLNTSHRFGEIELHRFDARSNRRTFRPILDLIGNARESVYVISPYVTSPFIERLREARANGANVTLLTPERNNWSAFKEYILWESRRSGFDVRLYRDRMVHMKAILIDDRYLIAGSSNFDFLSSRFLQELVAVITDRRTIAQFKERVLEKDLGAATAADAAVPGWRGHSHRLRMKLLTYFFLVLQKAFSKWR